MGLTGRRGMPGDAIGCSTAWEPWGKAHKLATTPQPHQRPLRTAGQDSFRTALTLIPSHCLQAATLANLVLSPCEAGSWLWQGIETALCQGHCSPQPCPLPTIEPQTSSFRAEEIPTLLPISQPWLKYLSQSTQMFNLSKHLNVTLEKRHDALLQALQGQGICFAPK